MYLSNSKHTQWSLLRSLQDTGMKLDLSPTVSKNWNMEASLRLLRWERCWQSDVTLVRQSTVTEVIFTEMLHGNVSDISVPFGVYKFELISLYENKCPDSVHGT